MDQQEIDVIKSDDNISIKSSESVTTSGEYEIVPSIESDIKVDLKLIDTQKGQLKIPPKIIPLSPVLVSSDDIADMEKNLDDVIHEMDDSDKNGEMHFHFFFIYFISLIRANKEKSLIIIL